MSNAENKDALTNAEVAKWMAHLQKGVVNATDSDAKKVAVNEIVVFWIRHGDATRPDLAMVNGMDSVFADTIDKKNGDATTSHFALAWRNFLKTKPDHPYIAHLDSHVDHHMEGVSLHRDTTKTTMVVGHTASGKSTCATARDINVIAVEELAAGLATQYKLDPAADNFAPLGALTNAFKIRLSDLIRTKSGVSGSVGVEQACLFPGIAKIAAGYDRVIIVVSDLTRCVVNGTSRGGSHANITAAQLVKGWLAFMTQVAAFVDELGDHPMTFVVNYNSVTRAEFTKFVADNTHTAATILSMIPKK